MNQRLKQTPSQTVGPFFAYGLCPEQYHYDMKSLFSPIAADMRVPGEQILIIGTVYDGEGHRVPDAIIETLQADASGRYAQTPEEIQATGFSGFARVGTGTDAQNRFIIETVKPGAVSSSAAPVIDVIVLMRGMLVHAYTRIYFDDEVVANERDEVLSSVPIARQGSLLAKCEESSSRTVYRFDIHMQGPMETVFFDL